MVCVITKYAQHPCSCAFHYNPRSMDPHLKRLLATYTGHGPEHSSLKCAYNQRMSISASRTFRSFSFKHEFCAACTHQIYDSYIFISRHSASQVNAIMSRMNQYIHAIHILYRLVGLPNKKE